MSEYIKRWPPNRSMRAPPQLYWPIDVWFLIANACMSIWHVRMKEIFLLYKIIRISDLRGTHKWYKFQSNHTSIRRNKIKWDKIGGNAARTLAFERTGKMKFHNERRHDSIACNELSSCHFNNFPQIHGIMTFIIKTEPPIEWIVAHCIEKDASRAHRTVIDTQFYGMNN